MVGNAQLTPSSCLYFAQEKVEKNREKLGGYISQIISATSRTNSTLSEKNGSFKLFPSRIEQPLCKFSGFAHGYGDKDYINNQEVVFSSSTKLPSAENLPPYTTWIFLDRFDIRFFKSFMRL